MRGDRRSARNGGGPFSGNGGYGRLRKGIVRHFDLDPVPAQHDYNSYLSMLRPDGPMVLVG
jgi:hypothetical protein